MRETITISLPAPLRGKLDRAVREEQMNRSDIIREALRRYFAVTAFRNLRGLAIPYAEKKGFFKDEEIFSQVS